MEFPEVNLFIESSETIGILFNGYRHISGITSRFLDTVSERVEKLIKDPVSEDLDLSDEISHFKSSIFVDRTPSPIYGNEVREMKKTLYKYRNEIDSILERLMKLKDRVAFGGNYLRAVIKRPKVYLREVNPEKYELVSSNIRTVNRALDWVEKVVLDVFNLVDQDRNVLTVIERLYIKTHIFEDADVDFEESPVDFITKNLQKFSAGIGKVNPMLQLKQFDLESERLAGINKRKTRLTEEQIKKLIMGFATRERSRSGINIVFDRDSTQTAGTMSFGIHDLVNASKKLNPGEELKVDVSPAFIKNSINRGGDVKTMFFDIHRMMSRGIDSEKEVEIVFYHELGHYLDLISQDELAHEDAMIFLFSKLDAAMENKGFEVGCRRAAYCSLPLEQRANRKYGISFKEFMRYDIPNGYKDSSYMRAVEYPLTKGQVKLIRSIRSGNYSKYEVDDYLDFLRDFYKKTIRASFIWARLMTNEENSLRGRLNESGSDVYSEIGADSVVGLLPHPKSIDKLKEMSKTISDFLKGGKEKGFLESENTRDQEELLKPGQIILKELEGVKYGMYNTKHHKVLYGNELFDYIDSDNTQEFLLQIPSNVIMNQVGTCYDTANYIIHRLRNMSPEYHIDRCHIIFYEYPYHRDPSQTQTHTAAIYRISALSDKWVHVEYSDNPNRGVRVLDTIDDVFIMKPIFVNWDAPTFDKPITSDDYYYMCRFSDDIPTRDSIVTERYDMWNLPDIMYFASPAELDEIHGPVFLSPYIGIASMFIIPRSAIMRQHISDEIGLPIVQTNYNLEYAEWKLPDEELTSPLDVVHVTHNIRSIKSIKVGKSSGYIYTIDVSDIKDQLNLFKTSNPNRELVYNGKEQLKVVDKMEHTVDWELSYSEENAGRSGHGSYRTRYNDQIHESALYEPPMKELPKHLENDPVHKWRADNGIELVHKEPSMKELQRIWKNWNLMTAEQKRLSDNKSKELFGMTNLENYKKLLQESIVEENVKLEGVDEDSSKPKQIDKQESDANGVVRKQLYIAFIEYAKGVNNRNTFGSVFDKDAFELYSYVPHELRYFYRLANPLLCVLDNSLTFFALSELKTINTNKAALMNEHIVFAADQSGNVKLFQYSDKKVYAGTISGATVTIGAEEAPTFDEYIQKLVGRDILGTGLIKGDEPIENEVQNTQDDGTVSTTTADATGGDTETVPGQEGQDQAVQTPEPTATPAPVKSTSTVSTVRSTVPGGSQVKKESVSYFESLLEE
jgi:hypothetical protein